MIPSTTLLGSPLMPQARVLRGHQSADDRAGAINRRTLQKRTPTPIPPDTAFSC